MSIYRDARRALRPVRMALRPPATRRRLLRNESDNQALRLLLLLGTAGDANCIDIGANSGIFLDNMLAGAPGGKHMAFEPLPDYAADLRRRYPDVDVREVALSNEAAEAAEFVRPIGSIGLDGYSGLKQRNYPEVPQRIERFNVPVSTLDDELPDDYRPAFIKIDVEGAEHDVLAGAQKTLSRHRPLVQFEHGPRASSSYGVTHAQLFDLLADQDYDVYDMDGDGPYVRDQFVETTENFVKFNFLGKPRTARA